MTIFPTTLNGRRVRLEPLSMSHVDGLAAAAAESRQHYNLTWVPETPALMREYVQKALADTERGLFVPFTTIDAAENRIVGSTRFGNLERWAWPAPPCDPRPAELDAAEIGWTWLAESAQHTFINTEAKLLMLGLAFETWKVRRVSLKTDARNSRSRNAIQRIGARFDGVLRGHMPAYDGGVRDTAFFSIMEAEWPSVRDKLEVLASRS